MSAGTPPADGGRDPVGLSLILPLRQGRGRPPLARHLHAALLRLMSEVGSELAEAQHADPGPSGRSWAVSPPFRHAGRWWFRLSAIGPTAPAWWCGAIRPATLTPTGWALGEHAGWRWRLAGEHELAPQPVDRGDECVALTFLTPTALSGVRGVGGDPLPIGSRLLESLRGRAASHAGGRLAVAASAVGAERLTEWCATNLRTAGFELRSVEHETVNTHGRSDPLVGALGWMLLRMSGRGGDERELASALFAASVYLGIGRKLSYGMGQTIGFFGPADRGPPPRIGWPAVWELHEPWESR